MIGIVYKSTGSWYMVKGEDQQYYECRLKGRFRLKEIKNTNPIAVGDRVTFHLSEVQGQGGHYRDCASGELHHPQIGQSLQADPYPCGQY